jgi:multidrug efflux pump subunit AcrA (membrane-fusion protein)
MINFPSINKEINSKIAQVGNYINPDNRSFKTRINIENTDQSIKPNLLADLKILDFEVEGIIIPSALIQQDQQGNQYVFTIKTESNETTVIKNIINVANEYNHEAYIDKGLSKNDTLINAGARIVKADDIVTVSN